MAFLIGTFQFSITMLLVDPSCPDFAGRYNSTHRFLQVDLNSLDVVVNLESWVMVLDFFSQDHPSHDPRAKDRRHSRRKASSAFNNKVLIV